MCPTAPGGLWTTGIKKALAILGTQLGSRISKARSCVTEALTDVQATTVRPYSVASTQLITPGHGYSGDMVRQNGTTGRVMFNAAELYDGTTPRCIHWSRHHLLILAISTLDVV
jgi:hypothetical protein